jgi:hypothetical protein
MRPPEEHSDSSFCFPVRSKLCILPNAILGRSYISLLGAIVEIEGLLKALPTAATSPFAFIGYVTVVLAWLLIAWRVQRNKNLLDALEKIPSDQRLSALRAEMGNIDPPSGFTPEQWLKSRIHTYYFLAFLALCFCLTMIGIVAYVLAPENLRAKTSSTIDLFAEPATREIDRREEYRLRYVATRLADGTKDIRPSMPYLDKVAANQEVVGIQYWYEPFKWEYPSLSIKIANNSQSTLLVSEILFEVVAAEVDLTPIPVIHENFYNIGHLQIVNEGWGKMLDPALEIVDWKKPEVDPRDIVFNWRFGLVQDACNGASPAMTANIPIALQDVDDRVNVDVERFVPKDLQEEPLICLRGTLTYTAAGNKARITLHFRSLVSRFNPGPGAPAPPSATYDLFLPSGKSGYVASVPVSQEIKPGATDHFLIRLSSDKSGKFTLRYHARVLSDVVIGGETVQISLLIPKSGASRGELDAKHFPELPPALWGGIEQAKTIVRVVQSPEDKSDLRIYLNIPSEKVDSCDSYYDAIIGRLKGGPFPPTVYLALVDSKGVMFCTSGTRNTG